MKSICLAPAYDLLSTVIYQSTTRNMAYNIGGEYNIDKIGRENFEKEADKLNLPRKILLEIFDELKNNIKSALLLSAEELGDLGYESAEYVKNNILENRNI